MAGVACVKRAALVVALLACGCASATREGPSSALVDFHVVPCSRDFPGHDTLRTSIVRQANGDTVDFVVRHPDACGLRARNPAFAVEAEVLQLRYDLEADTGMHLLCECEYRATFTFDRTMQGIEQVRFGEGPVQRVR